MMPNLKNPGTGLHWSWKANSTVDLPILAAIIGLFYAVVVYVGFRPKGDFHELRLPNKRALIDTVLTNRNAFFAKEIQRLTPLAQPKAPDKIGKKTSPKKKAIPGKSTILGKLDSARIRDTLDKYLMFQKKTAIDLVNVSHFNVDTVNQFFARYYSADRDSLLAAITGETDSTVVVLLRDTCCSPYPVDLTQRATLKIGQEPKHLLQFIDHNSIFGFWLVLSMAQMSMWFMLAVLVIGGVRRTNDIENAFPYDLRNGLVLAIMPAIVVAVFTGLVYFFLIGDEVISDKYFIHQFSARSIWYSIPGYLMATICFGAYLFLSNKLELLNWTATRPANNEKEYKDEFQRLKTAFQFVFNSSAVILSVFVIWLGCLFSAVNNTEVARFYYLVSGKQLLNYDFVYLMGIVHSLLLVIFYFPVRLQFNSLQLTKEYKAAAETEAAEKGTPAVTRVFKTFGEILGSILITASPFITTIVQKALAGLLGG